MSTNRSKSKVFTQLWGKTHGVEGICDVGHGCVETLIGRELYLTELVCQTDPPEACRESAAEELSS